MNEKVETMVAEARPRLLTERDACRYLSVSRSFLAKSRMDGTLPGHTPGPPYIKMGRVVRYDLADLDAWIAEHRFQIMNPFGDRNSGGRLHAID